MLEHSAICEFLMNESCALQIQQSTPVHSVPTEIPLPEPAVTLEIPQSELRAALAEHLEVLLGKLRGESLLVATLCYGLGVRVSQLQAVKMRDVSIVEKTIYLAGREREIPEVILGDLEEHIHDRLCGFEASSSSPRREVGLFSVEAFEALAAESRRVDAMFCGRMEIESGKGQRAKACFDSRLRILGWFHRRRAARRGIQLRSPIELFDKGPRIVRRGSRGAVDSYYLWRASRVLFV